MAETIEPIIVQCVEPDGTPPKSLPFKGLAWHRTILRKRSGIPIAPSSGQHVMGGVAVRPLVVAMGLLVLGFFTIAAIQDGQAMEATPTLLTFTAEQGGPNPVTPAVIFLKNNTRERNWATSYNAAWLSVTVFPTNLIPSDQLLVSVNVVGLTAGVYTGTVSIAGMKGDPVSIPVILTITDRSFTTLPPLLSTGTRTLTWATNTEPN